MHHGSSRFPTPICVASGCKPQSSAVVVPSYYSVCPASGVSVYSSGLSGSLLSLVQLQISSSNVTLWSRSGLAGRPRQKITMGSRGTVMSVPTRLQPRHVLINIILMPRQRKPGIHDPIILASQPACQPKLFHDTAYTMPRRAVPLRTLRGQNPPPPKPP